MSDPSRVFAEQLFAKKVFVVTGGGQGIGRAIVHYLRCLSATVVVVEHPKFCADTPLPDMVGVDLNDEQALVQCLPNIIQQYGRCDGLINNARAGQRTQPLAETAENINHCIGVGLTAPILLSQQLMDYAKMQPDTARVIVNISSTAAQSISAESGSYHATKAALDNLTKYMAVYSGQYQVRINAIAPGFIVKEQHKERFNQASNQSYRRRAIAAHPLARIGSEHDIAQAVAFLLSDASAFITGQTLVIDGGLTLRDGFATIMQANAVNNNEAANER